MTKALLNQADEFQESYENEDIFNQILDSQNDFFQIDKMSLLDIKDENVSVYIGNWAIKTVLKKKSCEVCEQMLHFPQVVNGVVRFEANETLTRYKSRTGDQAFSSTNNKLSYGHTITEETRKIVDHIVTVVKV